MEDFAGEPGQQSIAALSLVIRCEVGLGFFL